MANKKRTTGWPDEIRETMRDWMRDIAKRGGKARWKGVSAEDRRKQMSELGKASGKAKRSKKKK